MARDHDESLDDSQTDNLDDSHENLDHSVSEDSFNRSRARIRKKKKPPRVTRRKVSYCPNTSSTSFGSFNRSSRRSSGKNAVSRQYKKINAQLAQSLNYVKVELNQVKEELLVVKGEKLALQTENATLRGQVDPQIVEQEVQRRLFECIGPVKDCLNAALDNMVGLSDNLTQGLRLTTATSRVSLNNRQSGSSVALNRNSSIGTIASTSASSFRMRNATNFPPPSSNSPNRALPKSMVSPMVAGHTIKRPKIQLNRIAMQDGIGAIFVGENPVQPAPPQPDQTNEEEEEEEDEAEVESAEEEPEEEIAPSPNRPRRNRFNLTIIGEESRIEDSPLPASQPLERLDESDEEDGVQVLSGNVVEPDVSLLHTPQSQPSGPSPSSSGRRSRASVGRDLRITTEDAEQDVSIRRKSRTAESQRLSGMRQRLLASATTPAMRSPASSSGATARPGVGKPSRTSTGVRNSSSGVMRSPADSSRSSLSNTPLGRLSRSPYVDVMKTARHPHVLLSDLVISRHPAALGAASSHSPNRIQSRPSSSPVVMDNEDDNEGLEEEQGGNVFNMSNMPADPSDSFLERMCEENPLEGPSWLFATIKKKKGKKSSKGRMTAARRLSTVLSVGSEESNNSSARTTLSFDTSDLTGDRSTDASEVSGYVPGENILAPDLVGNPGVEETRLDLVDMEETEANGIGLDDSGEDKENESGEGDDNFIMVDGERTPLKELVFMNGGAAVRYNPELETGVTVESLKEAKILLDNIGVKGRRYSIEQDRRLSEENSARVRLSECYIDLSGGGACLVAPLDQMINISGAGTPRGGPGTPRAGPGTPLSGVGTPRGGVATPLSGVGTPRGVKVGQGLNIEQREDGEERRSVSVGKKRKLSNMNDEVSQNMETAPKRSRKTGGSSRIGKVRHSNVRHSDVRSISHLSRGENEQSGEGKVSENQKRINDRKSKAFLPAFIPFTPPNRAKKAKEKSQRMPRSKAAAQLLETDDDNEDEGVQSQPSTSDLVTNNDVEKEVVMDDMQQPELQVNSKEMFDSVEPDQQALVDNTQNDEEIDIIESPVITPKKKKKAKSTFARSRLSEFENLSPEINRCKSADPSKIVDNKMDEDLPLLSEENQPSKKSTGNNSSTSEMPEERILPVVDKCPSSTDVPAMSHSVDDDLPPSPSHHAADEVSVSSKEVEPEKSKNSPAADPEVSRRPRGRTTMVINYAAPEDSPMSVRSKEVEPEPRKNSPTKSTLELKKKAVSESFKPAEPEISRRPRGRTMMNINYAEPEDSPVVDLSKKARSKNNSGDKNSKSIAKQGVGELGASNASPEPEISTRPRGRTTMVINYAEPENSPVVDLTKKIRSRNTSGKNIKSTVDENEKLNAGDTKANEESTDKNVKVKKSRIKHNSGDKNSKSVSSTVSPADPNAGEGATKQSIKSTQDENTESVTSKNPENSHVSMEGNVDKKKASENVESVAGSSSAKSSDISAHKEPVKENSNKKKSKKDSNEVASEEVKEEGRSRRRAASAVSYKEPSIGKKLRQGDQHSVSVYDDFVPQTKKGKKKK